MPDPSMKRSASSTNDLPATGIVDRQAERERLVDDLAFLVVRQHHYNQRIGIAEIASDNTATRMLNLKQKRGK